VASLSDSACLIYTSVELAEKEEQRRLKGKVRVRPLKREREAQEGRTLVVAPEVQAVVNEEPKRAKKRKPTPPVDGSQEEEKEQEQQEERPAKKSKPAAAEQASKAVKAHAKPPNAKGQSSTAEEKDGSKGGMTPDRPEGAGAKDDPEKAARTVS
jgi:hypothetical protein